MDKDPGSSAVQSLVKDWQAHITMHYYTCTKEILKCLGQMYTAYRIAKQCKMASPRGEAVSVAD